MGMQIPCCVYPQEAAEGHVWASPAPFREDFPCVGTAERMPDFGRSFAPGSCSYGYRGCPETPGRFGDWFLKGKRAIAVARQFGGEERNFTGEQLWARGYAVSTVGFELEQVRQYIRAPEEADGSKG